MKRFNISILIFFTSQVLIGHGFAADMPITSVEKIPEQYVLEDKQTQLLQSLRMNANDGDPDSMLELSRELLANNKIKRSDLPLIKLLIDSAESKLGAPAVSRERELLSQKDTKLPDTTAASTESPTATQRPYDRNKSQRYATCAGQIGALIDYLKSNGKSFSPELDNYSNTFNIAATIFTDFNTVIQTYNTQYVVQKIQIERFPEQIKYYMPQIYKDCLAIYKTDLAVMKPFEERARDEYYDGLKSALIPR